MKKFLFVDLDDTLFQTLKKCQGRNDLRPVGFLPDGSPLSWISDKQRALFKMLAQEMILIPTTARNQNALSRVDLPFSSYAIIDYGGVILQPDGQPDTQWLQHTRQQSAAAHSGLCQVVEMMREYASANGMAEMVPQARLVEDFEIPFYALIKHPQADDARLTQIEEALVRPWVATAGADFYIHRNGNNLAILPKTLSKKYAVQHLQQQFQAEFGSILSIGMGDSRSDASFMTICDYAMLPQTSQLADVLREHA